MKYNAAPGNRQVRRAIYKQFSPVRHEFCLQVLKISLIYDILEQFLSFSEKDQSGKVFITMKGI